MWRKWLSFFVFKILPIVISAASATAAIVPRFDRAGNPTEWHRYLDVFALNVYNSAHAQYIPTVDCKEGGESPD